MNNRRRMLVKAILLSNKLIIIKFKDGTTYTGGTNGVCKIDVTELNSGPFKLKDFLARNHKFEEYIIGDRSI